MSDEETAKGALIRILYSKIDGGLYKKDAYEIVDAIEALIQSEINRAFKMFNEKLNDQIDKRS